MKEWLFRWSPSFLFMGLIFMASSTSGNDIPDFGTINFFVMKGGHLLGYALLGAAFFHGLSRGDFVKPFRALSSEILVILYACSDEWHQSFTPGRHPSLQDICIDAAGGLLGIAFLYIARKRSGRSARQARSAHSGFG